VKIRRKERTGTKFRHLSFEQTQFHHLRFLEIDLMVGRKDKYSNAVCLMYKTWRVARRPHDWTATNSKHNRVEQTPH